MLENSTGMPGSAAPIIGVSSWALHDALGAPPNFGVAAGAEVPVSPGPRDGAAMPLLDLPALLARQGFDALQICHFHLPSRDTGYLSDLRGALQDAGLPLHALLLDEGDLTHGENGARDEAWIADWLAVAAQLGAQEMRVIAGKTPHDDAVAQSASALNRLVTQGRDVGVAVLTENWYPVLSTPKAVHELMERCGNNVRFLLDFGNWGGLTKYDDLAAIAPHAHSCHAQVAFDSASQIDEAHLARCLALPFSASFSGLFTLVNGGTEGVTVSRDFIRSHYPPASSS